MILSRKFILDQILCINVVLIINLLVLKVTEYPVINKYLPQYLCNNSQELNKVNNEDWSVLMLVTKNSNIYSNSRIVELLLKHKANINSQNNNRWSALMMVSRYSNTDSNSETVKLLLKYGADVNLQENRGNRTYNCM